MKDNLFAKAMDMIEVEAVAKIAFYNAFGFYKADVKVFIYDDDAKNIFIDVHDLMQISSYTLDGFIETLKKYYRGKYSWDIEFDGKVTMIKIYIRRGE